MKGIIALILLYISDLWLWLYKVTYSGVQACIGKKEEHRHICTEFEDVTEPVMLCGQLVHAKKCKECGRTVTSVGIFFTPEQMNILAVIATRLVEYKLPKDDKGAAEELHALAEIAKTVLTDD